MKFKIFKYNKCKKKKRKNVKICNFVIQNVYRYNIKIYAQKCDVVLGKINKVIL